ncbi:MULTISPECIES: putative signal transducing protein [Xanthomarina]|jgi:hypothetical protein|uniref:Uncharacterized protein n=1 Tax=Xanthomarina gelatinilytica TaxID=1137281 RepID=M7MHE5_9FLAO|nr:MULTISPECIES: DUF2007 domain-containing protein [Xanthomarina]MCB0388705.1 DUF2007 domain-containing protein [Winogradskyella sp.]EMQ94240.1 hypothetical protein D778_00955 [Xanthomarina gelatinilytica]MAL22142.1 hypothetical protein [Xanthomarina sp.]MDX1317204.1 DUF2007 domain-containing protein [Xanthomarina gelatinilytica]HAB28042.1 hypothetical protein [Xanthomarina gelatinilytica]|tara:strand:- start:409 stop:642 length:234 start_codon:yes stop_codon:yes gene_type:complete
MDSSYVKIYTGSFIIAQLIVDKLDAVGISPIVKDETESGRLAGFGSSVPGYQEIFVSEDELDAAVPIVESVTAELQS